MFQAITAALYALFKAIIPFTWERLNESTTAKDAPPVPANVRNRWRLRVRKHKSRIRS